MAVPAADSADIKAGLTGMMNDLPELEPATNSSNVISRYPTGTWNDANRVFDSLPLDGIRIVGTTPYGDIRYGILPNGTAVVVRPVSSDGTPTLQILDSNRPNGKIVTVQEIRFGIKN